jgi:hypothetical protein
MHNDSQWDGLTSDMGCSELGFYGILGGKSGAGLLMLLMGSSKAVMDSFNKWDANT